MEGTKAVLAVPVKVGDAVKFKIEEMINAFSYKMTPVLREKEYDTFLENTRQLMPCTGMKARIFWSLTNAESYHVHHPMAGLHGEGVSV